MQVAQGRTIKGLAHFVMGGPVDGAVAITVVADRERERECQLRNSGHVLLFCTIVWTNPKAGHLINRRVVGRATCLRVVATTPKPGRKERKEREREREHWGTRCYTAEPIL